MTEEELSKRMAIYIQRIYGTLVLDYSFDKEIADFLKKGYDTVEIGTRRSAFVGYWSNKDGTI